MENGYETIPKEKKKSFLGNPRSLRNKKKTAVKICETNTYFQVIYLTLHIKHLSLVINGSF